MVAIKKDDNCVRSSQMEVVIRQSNQGKIGMKCLKEKYKKTWNLQNCTIRKYKVNQLNNKTLVKKGFIYNFPYTPLHTHTLHTAYYYIIYT